MKAIVIYNSQTGFTARYARWIAEAAGADILPLSTAKKADLSPYDVIIFGSWARAGGLSKGRWFKDNIRRWRGKQLIVFCVGASPADSPETESFLRQNFTDEERKAVSVFYCPGGLDYEKMPVPSRLMLRMFVKSLRGKKDRTEAEEGALRMLSSSYDISDKKYILPLLACLKEQV